MSKKIITIFFVLIILLVLGLSLVYKEANNISLKKEELNKEKKLKNKDNVLKKDEGIIIDFLKENEKISFPLKISDQFCGYWFFENEFSVKFYDENNNLVSQTILTTQEEWTIENFASFRGELIFSNLNIKNRILRFLSANPLGEEKNQKIFKLLIRV